MEFTIRSVRPANPGAPAQMDTRGDRPLVKALLGSVSAAVARSSEIPLLLVPPPVWIAEQGRTASRAVVPEDVVLPPPAW